MMTRTLQTYLTPEEYLALERKAIPDADTVRSEYLNGEIIAMSGASFAHNLITGNIFAELHTRLRGSGYVVFANEMRVSVPTAESYFYLISVSKPNPLGLGCRHRLVGKDQTPKINLTLSLKYCIIKVSSWQTYSA